MSARGVLELFQAEWCPNSHRVRMRLTELGLDWCARNVALEPEQRDAMEEATGGRSIPTLKHGDVVVSGADSIIAYLDAQYTEPPDAHLHRRKLERDEWPHWLELHGTKSVQS
jgi:glutathione S-transferase